MLGRLVAILTFSRRTASLTGPAKVFDGDTIVVAGQLVRLHGIDAPELDQTFQWRGQQIACGAMSLAAREVLISGVKVRGSRAGPARSPRRQGLLARWGRRRPQAGGGGVGARVPAVLDGLSKSVT